MSRAEKLIFSYVVLFKPLVFFFFFSPSLSVSLFTSIRYLQTVLLMKILALPTPRESECTLPDGSSYSMCFASSSIADSEKDLKNLGRYFLLVFFFIFKTVLRFYIQLLDLKEQYFKNAVIYIYIYKHVDLIFYSSINFIIYRLIQINLFMYRYFCYSCSVFSSFSLHKIKAFLLRIVTSIESNVLNQDLGKRVNS